MRKTAHFGPQNAEMGRVPQPKSGKIKKTSFIKQKQDLSRDDSANGSFLRQAVDTPHKPNIDEGAAAHSMSQ